MSPDAKASEVIAGLVAIFTNKPPSKPEPSDVAAWPSKALDAARSDGIAHNWKYDRHSPCVLQQRVHGGGAAGQHDL